MITLKSYCHLSRNLYNEANYIIRHEFFKTGMWIRYDELYKLLKGGENYRALPAQTAQQILKIVDRNWKSFFNAMNEWKENPGNFNRRPRPPKKYKKKEGLFMLVFTNQQVKIKEGQLIFPK